MQEAAAQEEQMARSGGGGGASGVAGGVNAEGWGEYLTRQLNERTERLNIMNDSMESMNEQSAGWAEDVNKFVSKQKKNAIMGGLKSKFF